MIDYSQGNSVKMLIHMVIESLKSQHLPIVKQHIAILPQIYKIKTTPQKNSKKNHESNLDSLLHKKCRIGTSRNDSECHSQLRTLRELKRKKAASHDLQPCAFDFSRGD